MMLINATMRAMKVLALAVRALFNTCVTILLSILHISRTEHHSSCCDESSGEPISPLTSGFTSILFQSAATGSACVMLSEISSWPSASWLEQAW